MNDDFDEWIESHSTSVDIKSSEHEKVDVDCAAAQQTHLTPSQQAELAEVLKAFTNLFSGEFGCCPGHQVHLLELNDDAKPFQARPHAVPDHNEVVFKEESERLVLTGALSRAGPSEWLSPTFTVPKKDGRVRWVSDFCALNKFIKLKACTLPCIQDILKKRSGCKFSANLDISMQRCTFKLDESSKDLCTICTPFGNC
jgi:hypothetical protein